MQGTLHLGKGVMIMIKKVYVKANSQATVMCDCGKIKTMDMSKFDKRITEVKVKCNCGAIFTAIFDYRQRYRKHVKCYGNINIQNKQTYHIQISDISMSGIKFEIIGNENMLSKDESFDIKVGDYANVIFRLDDIHKSKLDRMVVIRRIMDNHIGAEFCDNIVDNKLGFYLLP
jgi:hypothetical protein